jgi:hypothetical protein
MKLEQFHEIEVRNEQGELTPEEIEQCNRGHEKLRSVTKVLSESGVLYPEEFGSDIEHLTFVNHVIHSFIGVERRLFTEPHVLKITCTKDEVIIQREGIKDAQTKRNKSAN